MQLAAESPQCTWPSVWNSKQSSCSATIQTTHENPYFLTSRQLVELISFLQVKGSYTFLVSWQVLLCLAFWCSSCSFRYLLIFLIFPRACRMGWSFPFSLSFFFFLSKEEFNFFPSHFIFSKKVRNCLHYQGLNLTGLFLVRIDSIFNQLLQVEGNKYRVYLLWL